MIDLFLPEDVAKLAYLAGLIDSDGYISVAEQKPAKKSKAKSVLYYPIVAVTNTDVRMMEWIYEWFGGSYSCRSNGKMAVKMAAKGWKPRYEWRVTGKNALKLANALAPYMVIKKDRLDLILQFEDIEKRWVRKPTRGGNLTPEWVNAERLDIRKQVQLLNVKGVQS